MPYEQGQVMAAFKLYTELAARGRCDKEAMRLYLADDGVRALVELFAAEVKCAVIPAGDQFYLVPLAISSPLHVSNENLKRQLSSRWTNADLYLMYVAVIVFFGEFYDSYQTTEPTRDFLPMRQWLDSMNQRMLALKELDPEELKKLDRAQEYNWSLVAEKWDAWNDLKEGARSQDARSTSRLAFLNTVGKFLQNQDLVSDLGEDEWALTEKARAIVGRYYMDVEHNRGLLDFMYQLEHEERK